MADTDGTKTCAACRVEKPVTEYRMAGKNLYAYCRPCAKAYARRHYEANRQAYKEKTAAWRKENADRYLQSNKDYYAKNREAYAEKYVAYYQQNRETCIARSVDWRKADPTKARKNEAAYRERNREVCNERIKAWKAQNKPRLTYYTTKRGRGIRQATPAWADHAAMMLVYDEARRLTRETGVKHHVDHIVPINNKIVCGLHVPWNLEVVPAMDNLRKCNYRWPDMP